MRLFKKRNVTEWTENESRKVIITLNDINRRARELERKNQLMKAKYNNDEKYVRLHKRLMEKDPFFKKESVQELGEVVNYHTGISGMRIVAAMKKNPVLKKYAIQIPVGKKLNTYDV